MKTCRAMRELTQCCFTASVTGNRWSSFVSMLALSDFILSSSVAETVQLLWMRTLISGMVESVGREQLKRSDMCLDGCRKVVKPFKKSNSCLWRQRSSRLVQWCMYFALCLGNRLDRLQSRVPSRLASCFQRRVAVVTNGDSLSLSSETVVEYRSSKSSRLLICDIRQAVVVVHCWVVMLTKLSCQVSAAAADAVLLSLRSLMTFIDLTVTCLIGRCVSSCHVHLNYQAGRAFYVQHCRICITVHCQRTRTSHRWCYK